jgi:hypothetical protein
MSARDAVWHESPEVFRCRTWIEEGVAHEGDEVVELGVGQQPRGGDKWVEAREDRFDRAEMAQIRRQSLNGWIVGTGGGDDVEVVTDGRA